MKEIGIGIIGLGYIGKTHFNNSLKLDNANLIAVADISKKGRNWARENGIKQTYEDYNDLLKDDNVDAVIIALPTHLHKVCAVEAAVANKDILLEKPIARNVKEAKTILDEGRKNSVKIMMGYPMRFDSIFINQKKEIDSGGLGEVVHANATYSSVGPFFERSEEGIPLPVPEWWFSKELTGGGVLIDIGCHLINLLRWYFGEIKWIKSYVDYRSNLDIEDHAICTAKFESGTTSVIDVGWFSTAFKLKVEALGSIKHSEAETLEPTFFSKVRALASIILTGTSPWHKAHFDELQYFINCLTSEEDPTPSGEDGLRDIEAISKAYKNQIITRD